MKLLLILVATASPGLAATVGSDGNLLFTDLEIRHAFTAGIATQTGFECAGLVIRMLRNLRSSGRVDLGG